MSALYTFFTLLSIFYKSFSLLTFIPSSSNSLAVIPFPGIFLPEKLPSYIRLHPQEGLPSFSIASLHTYKFAIFRVSLAPLAKSSVKS